MHFYPVSYSYYRSGSDVGLGAGQRRYSTREVEPTDSGDSTLSDLDGRNSRNEAEKQEVQKYQTDMDDKVINTTRPLGCAREALEYF
ncbi:hypothetical protein QE152_g40808 [Popillia japonica]|uniref:Uncharacterized protein n=1 Tax=Popillia japonica TaxID=7064 RepID=A0AAW1HFD8_POPJA